MWFDISREDNLYSLLVLPVYILMSTLNLLLVVVAHPGIAPGSRVRVLRDSAFPSLALELLNGVLASVAAFVCIHAQLGAAVALVMVLAVTIPLARTVATALKRDEDLVALRQVSDERAAEVSRLSEDRDRLLTEVLQAEQRERGRLAGSLHDGPMQRLTAMRQDAAPDSTRTGATLTPRSPRRARSSRRSIPPRCASSASRLRCERRSHRSQSPAPSRSPWTARGTTASSRRRCCSRSPRSSSSTRSNTPTRLRSPSSSSQMHESVVMEIDDDGVGIDVLRGRTRGPSGPRRARDGAAAVEDAGGRSTSRRALTAARARGSSCRPRPHSDRCCCRATKHASGRRAKRRAGVCIGVAALLSEADGLATVVAGRRARRGDGPGRRRRDSRRGTSASRPA